MKKKVLSIILSLSMLLAACGSSGAPAPATSTVEPTGTESSATDTSQANPGIKVEKELFDVEITVPADFVGDSTQEDLDKICQEHGYKSITLNDDGSATYVMTKSQHKAAMDEMAASIRSSLEEMANSEDYPDYTSVTVNDDFTSYTVTTKATELGLGDSFVVFGFYLYSGMYAAFDGNEIDNVHVDFVNADTGEIIHSADSSDMAK
ncbi:MAG: hypothetical protein K2H41_12350 [Acetatifactor sp.]|nr:hypothetical protein [Acetatifactor sp.]